MVRFDLIGLGNALVDSEFHVTDSFLKKKGFEKGTMHLVDSDEQTNLLNSLEKELGQNNRKIMTWVEKHNFDYVDFDYKIFDPFFNINTINDLEKAENFDYLND